jgi:hypothetical protein
MLSRIGILICILLIALFWGCEREYEFRDGNGKLAFSTDTVAFDTVFTSVNSATQNFRVYNPVSDDMIIDAIELAGGDNSDFIINVNGTAESTSYEVPLRGNDSLFVFVEVNVDPSSDNTPFIVSDSINFYTRNQMYTVHLVAYGQNVIPLRQVNLKTQTLSAEKPYLIYDWVVVDSTETLTIDPGVRLYFHRDASLIVFGSIQVKGELDNPVLFASDRLEEWYKDKYGQWGYIHLMPGSHNNVFNNTTIRNGTMGLVVDSVGIEEDDPPLSLSNVRIEHIAAQGLIAQNSSIEASNSVFSDCGSASVALTVGGNYKFYHCTIANYFSWTIRSTPALVISNYYTDADKIDHYFSLDAANFYNCIITGRNNNEVRFDFHVDADKELTDWVNVNFFHSLVTVGDDEVNLYPNAFSKNVILNENPGFIDVSKYNYSCHRCRRFGDWTTIPQ